MKIPEKCHCRVSKVQMKNGGASVSVIQAPIARPSTRITGPNGNVVIEGMLGDEGLTLERAIWLLQDAERELLKDQ